MPVMVALNVVRVFAVLFLMLAAEGRLSGPFPYSAAWGDIITGVGAVPVLWLLKDGGTRHATAIAAWNLFGAVDLVLAIGFGITSAEGSPLQLFPGPGSGAMQHAPWSFVPTVLVPIWLILQRSSPCSSAVPTKAHDVRTRHVELASGVADITRNRNERDGL